MRSEPTIEAGRELDAAIAERVMGWTNCRVRVMYDARGLPSYGGGTPPEGGKKRPYPAYSTDIAAAWSVVERFVRDTRFHLDSLGFDGEEWRCAIGHDNDEGDADGWSFAEANTAPLAICLAALKALAPTTTASEPSSTEDP